MSEIERHAKVMADARELGARRAQVSLLHDALRRFGRHEAYCPKIAETYVPYNGTAEDMERAKLAAEERAEQATCNCGLAEALLVGAGAEQACGIKEGA